MKNMISKIGKIVSVFLLAISFVVMDTESVNAASKTISLGKATKLPGYIGGQTFFVKRTSSGKYVYCITKHKLAAQNTSATLQGTMNAGVAYIMEHGYPNKSFTGDSKKDYYITQVAVWKYLDETTGSNNLNSSFTKGSDKYGLRKYINQLVSAAKKAKKNGYESGASLNVKANSSKMSLTSNGKYYVTTVDANAKNITGKYKVTVVSAPAGTFVTNMNDNKQNEFASDKNFKVKVPAEKVKPGKTITVKVKVTASSKVQKAYLYKPANGKMQNVALLEPVTKDVADTVKMTASKKKEVPYLIVKKVDSVTGNTVAGATLVIKNSNGKVVKTFTSTKEGTKFTDLALGTYTVQETKAPNGYILNSNPVTFTLKNGGNNVEVRIKNAPEVKKQSVIIKKVDSETGKLIAGATLVVKDANGNTVKTFTSSTSGTKFTDLAVGNYTVVETEAPAGYELNSTPVAFTISEGSNTTVEVIVKNNKEVIPGSVIIKKVDKETGETVSGATLVIKDANGKVVKTFTSTTAGNTFTDLEAGSYTVTETAAPAGYKLNSTPVSFEVKNGENSSVEVVVENEKEVNRAVIIKKVDSSTGNQIAGATLVVKDANGNIIKTFESTVNGYKIENLAAGTYTVTETKAPKGYKLNSTPVEFTVSDNATTSVEVVVENQPESAIVTIAKVDSVTGKLIPGAELLVTNEAGEEVARFTSTTEAYTLNDLEYGTYTVEEVSAPEGYFLNEEKQTFTIDENHLSAQVTIKDVPKTCDNGGKDADECSVDVPNTGSNGIIYYILGIAIVSLGALYVRKNSNQA